ncbi:hypothetical protein GOP47_0017403 [Adiantum capillus-veneris]|uniref:Uncharacterized protein n=1 Tax=Adiantum capillus-veneris TaxID=13818 RepID=A0A9D4UFD5_ADICA|nr:hypothetical protein GOP47_0017403 [Adiantum capillus-veneris]
MHSSRWGIFDPPALLPSAPSGFLLLLCGEIKEHLLTLGVPRVFLDITLIINLTRCKLYKNPYAIFQVTDLDCTYSAIRQEIVQDGIVSQEFDFVIKDEDDDELCTLNSTQEERWQIENKTVGIKRLVSTGEQSGLSKRVCRSVNDTKEDSAMDVVEEGCERVQNFEGGEVQGNNMLKSLLLTRSSLALWKAQCEKTRKKLRERNPPRDDNFELATEDVNNNPVI